METGTVIICPNASLDRVTVAEYVPGSSPVGSAVRLTGVDPNAPKVPLLREVFNEAPPEMVLTAIAKGSDPPPAFAIEAGRVRAAAPLVKENCTDDGLRVRLGWPGAVTVNDTGTVCVKG